MTSTRDSASAILLAQALERAAGPENVGTHADVARLMEAVFGERMAARQEQVRASIGRNNLADLLRESGLPARELPVASDQPPPAIPSELAPPAPADRYARPAPSCARHSPSCGRDASHGGPSPPTAVGVAIGVVATSWALTTRTPGRVIEKPVGLATASMAPSEAHPAPTLRKVVLTLPFASVRLDFDDEPERVLDPPSDAVALEVPAATGTRHHVIATAPDGTRAEGYALEADGIARPEGDGYSFTAPAEATGGIRHVGTPATPHRLGTVHNGFTKLR